MYLLLHDAIFSSICMTLLVFVHTCSIYLCIWVYICCLIAQLKLEIQHLITLVFVLFYMYIIWYVSFCLLRFFLSFMCRVGLFVFFFWNFCVFEAAGAREVLRLRLKWRAAWPTETWPVRRGSASAYSCTIWPRPPTRTSCGSCSDRLGRWPASRFVLLILKSCMNTDKP